MSDPILLRAPSDGLSGLYKPGAGLARLTGRGYGARMNPLLDEIYRTRRVLDAEGNPVNPFPSSIRRGLGNAFYHLLIERDLRNTLEIGLAYGLSALFIGQAHRDRGEGSHIAIDPGQERYRSIGKLNLERAGLGDVVRVIEAPSYEALPELLGDGHRFDFAFIDGNHLFDYALVDFFYVDLMLEVGGIVVFDDLWMRGVRGAVTYALRNRTYRRVKLKTTEGLPLGVAVHRVARKVVQDPLNWRDLRLKWTAEGVCLLEKTADDDRAWTFYRRF